MNKQGGLMSKCVLLSIRPQYCELIANGKKTIEVRKSRPKLETPFKCYIYCTAPKKFYKISEHMATSAEYLHLCDGKVTMSDGFEFFGREDYEGLNRKVIGEFVCDDIDEISVHYDTLYCVKNSQPNKLSQMCLTIDEVKQYLKDKNLGYNWHISDLQIYDKPRELNEFGLTRPFQSWGYVEEYDGKH
jgi:predicted transcriptional regulator